MSSINFSEVIKFKNGSVSGSFVQENEQPVQFKIENVVAPLGISDFNNRSSIILNIEDSHDVSKLLDVQAGVLCNDAWKKFDFSPIIKTSEKYGKQLKINVTDYTNGFRIYSKEATKLIVKKCGKIGDGFIVLSEILLILNINKFKIDEVSSVFINRIRGESSVNFKLIVQSLLGLIKLFFIKKNYRN